MRGVKKTDVAQRHKGGASVTAFSGIDVTPTPTPTPTTPTNEEVFNGRRHNDKYISGSTGHFDRRPVIFNTHTILLTKSISSLSNIKLIMIIIKKKNQ